MDIQILTQKFCDYSTFIRGYSAETIRRYKLTIGLFCKFANIKDIEEVTADNVRNFFFNGRIQRGWSAGSFITYHKSLIVFFRWCVQEKYMAANPADDLELPKLEKRHLPRLPSRTL